MSAKLCKYECMTSISWDAKNSRFIEADGTPHTKERCASLKAPKPKTEDIMSTEKVVATTNNGGDYAKMHLENIQASKELTLAIRELAAAVRAGRIGA